MRNNKWEKNFLQEIKKNLLKEFFIEDRADKSQYRVYIGENTFMGVYEYRKNEKKFYPVKMFIS